MILDTNAVSAILSADPRITTILDVASKHHLPVIVLGEYRFGILGSRRQKPLQAGLKKLESQSIILSPDQKTAVWYASIRHELKELGRPIPEGDLWIAALARQHALDVVSQDQHFDLVKHVQRIGW